MPDELVDKMSNEIAAAEDNLRIWTEKYEMEVIPTAIITKNIDAYLYSFFILTQ